MRNRIFLKVSNDFLQGTNLGLKKSYKHKHSSNKISSNIIEEAYRNIGITMRYAMFKYDKELNEQKSK